MGKLDNKVAVITGGNSGIGLATARRMILEGAKVAIFGRNQKTLDAAREDLGSGTIGVQGDVKVAGDLERLFSEVEKQLGKVDVVFVNAGGATYISFEEMDEANYDHQMDTNVKGAYFTVQKAVPYLNDGASIVLTTSVAGVKGLPGFSVYSATKAALRSLARSLSAELVDRGIRVNAVAPGPIETPIFGRMGLSEEQSQQIGQQFSQVVPLKRVGQPEEVASAVLFLASQESSYIVGTELAVDGGMTQL